VPWWPGLASKGSNADQLSGLFGLFVTDNGILYITDHDNHRIQKWVLGATSGVTATGTGVVGSRLSQFKRPNSILVDSNECMYIADEGNDRILRWTAGANVGECIAGCSGNVGVDANQLYLPASIAFDSSGSMYVSDLENN
jgi:sugar lactone lactonase YvrE